MSPQFSRINQNLAHTLAQGVIVGATSRCHTEIVTMLLENKVVVTSEAITQALGHTSILSLLLDQGAMPKASNLEDAIENEHSFSILLLLLRHPQLFPDFQPQSISLALNSGPTKTIEIFLQLGQALPHIELEDSALHRAAAK